MGPLGQEAIVPRFSFWERWLLAFGGSKSDGSPLSGAELEALGQLDAFEGALLVKAARRCRAGEVDVFETYIAQADGVQVPIDVTDASPVSLREGKRRPVQVAPDATDEFTLVVLVSGELGGGEHAPFECGSLQDAVFEGSAFEIRVL